MDENTVAMLFFLGIAFIVGMGLLGHGISKIGKGKDRRDDK